MKLVILSSDLDSLRKRLPPPPEPIRFLILRESRASLKIWTYLKQRGQTEELPRVSFFRERSGWFRTEYVKALGCLNTKFASREWWAMPFTTKNPISTDLCRDTLAFLLIVDLASHHDGVLVVVTESEALAGQVRAWGLTKGVTVVNAVRPASSVKGLIKRLAPLATLMLVLRTLWYRFWMGWKKLPGPTGDQRPVLLVSLVHPHSFQRDGQFKDTYLGSLSEWLVARNVQVIVAGIVQGQSVSLANAFRATRTTVICLPLEAVLGMGDILRCGVEALRVSRGALAGSSPGMSIGGIPLEELVRSAIREAYASGEVFRSLYLFHCARRLASSLKIARCIYPYVNRAWEKLLLLGIRAADPTVRIVGYQHASVTSSHTNFIFSEKEAEATPLPDAIVTMGEVTKDWLIGEGKHPEALLTVGCALRQTKSVPNVLRKRRAGGVSHVLVALATSLTEYVLTLALLEKAGLCQDGRCVRIRPHPTIPLDQAIQLFPDGQVRFSYNVSTRTVAEDLDWADVVLYASSTIGLEGIGLGIPAVYLDLGDILDTDPMVGWTEFKWTAKEPVHLGLVLGEIEALSERQYEARQQLGLAYAKSYLTPVTDDCLKVFCEA